MKRVMVCNSSAAEIDLIQVALGKKFALHAMTRYKPGNVELSGMDAVVVDANFTDAQGLDFIMEVNSTAHLPVLIVTPPEDPHCAIEARRIGVFNYLVKTDKIYSVLEVALNEATERFNDEENLKRTVLAQRQRIAELEKQLSRSGSMKALATTPPPPPRPCFS